MVERRKTRMFLIRLWSRTTLENKVTPWNIDTYCLGYVVGGYLTARAISEDFHLRTPVTG